MSLIDRAQLSTTERRRAVTRTPATLGGRLIVAGLLILAMGGCDGGDHIGPNATVKDQIELTREEPAMAIEFEAGFVSLEHDSGITGYFSPLHPKGSEFIGLDAQIEVWDGEAWVQGWSSEITHAGRNSFLYRWTFQLEDDVDRKLVPIEVMFYTLWSDQGPEPVPDDSEVSDVELVVVSKYRP